MTYSPHIEYVTA